MLQSHLLPIEVVGPLDRLLVEIKLGHRALESYSENKVHDASGPCIEISQMVWASVGL